MSEQRPSVGRIVHYVMAGQCVAGIVTKVDPVQLHIWPPEMTDGAAIGTGYDGTEKPVDGSWHWPPSCKVCV